MSEQFVIPCAVTVGTFGSEYVVRVGENQSFAWEGIVDKGLVQDVEGEVEKGKYGKGNLEVFLISYENGTALIDLPSEGWGQGTRLRIPKNLLIKAKHIA